MLGDADPDWSKFASEPTHPLRAFLTRHPSIRDLAIGCDLDAECGFQMDPDDLFSTLASVKHLGCPSFVFEAVATSKLTAQLESLAITNLALYIGDPLRPTAKALAEDSLPNLRKLEIWADMCDSELEAETIEGFMLAAKGLEELAFQPGVPDYDEFLSALGGAGNLRRIRLNEQQVLELGYSGADWETLMVELAETCPRLEFIAKYEGKDVWKVIRGADLDEPSVVKVDIRSL
ncbi:hypothetical protein FRC11_006672 [Ceratobasidium sp. 423]|nr:hypothetical protein FRC11_006672 [Ceratobasidium sp. 423]